MKSTHPKIVRWSDEDGCYIGQCPTLFAGGVHGPNEMKVYRELCRVVKEWEMAARQKTTSPRGIRSLRR